MADTALALPVQIAMENYSDLQRERLSYIPPVPEVLAAPASIITVEGDKTLARSASDDTSLRSWFKNTYPQFTVNIRRSEGDKPVAARVGLKIGVVFCGRQCPGANNVVAGLLDYLSGANANNELLGFVGGTRGLFERNAVSITPSVLASFRNQGGFHLLGRSVDKIRSEKDQAAALATAEALSLDGLVLLGGTYTNSDAAHLAEYFSQHQQGPNRRHTAVIGVPATIDGDIHNPYVEATLGFDTATKVYSQLVGNLATDANSAKKYYYFIRLMGRAASHITQEVALQTHPNVTLLGEELEARKLTLTDIVRELADVVCARAVAGKQFGVVLVPEGAVSYIPELRALIAEMNSHFADGTAAGDISGKLTPWSRAVLAYLPPLIREQLFLERESSGAVQLSQISTEKLLAELVGEELLRRKAAGGYAGKYATICHFFGYQARSSLPSNFDCAYGNALGSTAGALAAGGYNGYMATVRKLAKPVSAWEPAGIPLTAMTSVPAVSAATVMGGGQSFAKALSTLSAAKGTGERPVVESREVDIKRIPFGTLQARSAVWVKEDHYSNPGPIQFHGPVADVVTATLALERHDYMERIVRLRSAVDEVLEICRPGVSDSILDAAITGVGSLRNILTSLRE